LAKIQRKVHTTNGIPGMLCFAPLAGQIPVHFRGRTWKDKIAESEAGQRSKKAVFQHRHNVESLIGIYLHARKKRGALKKDIISARTVCQKQTPSPQKEWHHKDALLLSTYVEGLEWHARIPVHLRGRTRLLAGQRPVHLRVRTRLLAGQIPANLRGRTRLLRVKQDRGQSNDMFNYLDARR